MKDFAVADEVNPTKTGEMYNVEKIMVVGRLTLQLQELQHRKFSAGCRQDILNYLSNGIALQFADDEQQYQQSVRLEPPSMQIADDLSETSTDTEATCQEEAQNLDATPHNEAAPGNMSVPVWKWTTNMIGAWLKENNMGDYQQIFNEKAPTGLDFLMLSNEQLIEMGITILGHRKKMLALGNDAFSRQLGALLREHPLTTWKPALVLRFFNCQGLSSFEKVLSEKNLGGKELSGLNNLKLIEMNVTALGHRKKILSLVNKLAQPAQPWEWTVDEVAGWMRTQNFEEPYINTFVEVTTSRTQNGSENTCTHLLRMALMAKLCCN